MNVSKLLFNGVAVTVTAESQPIALVRWNVWESPACRVTPWYKKPSPGQSAICIALLSGGRPVTFTVTVESQPEEFCKVKICDDPAATAVPLKSKLSPAHAVTSKTLAPAVKADTFTVTVESQPEAFCKVKICVEPAATAVPLYSKLPPAHALTFKILAPTGKAVTFTVTVESQPAEFCKVKI